MVGRADRLSGIGSRIGAVALVALCGGCATASDPAGFSVVTQDKYDFMSCPEIVPQRNALIVREKQLSELVSKAETGFGGAIVSYAAYRSELAQTRAMIAAANRAAQKNSCDLTKK